jgi:hypothetical protein
VLGRQRSRGGQRSRRRERGRHTFGHALTLLVVSYARGKSGSVASPKNSRGVLRLMSGSEIALRRYY